MDDLNIYVIIAQLINFWLLFFIFYYFLGNTIIKTIEDRRKKLESLDNSDDVVREKIEAAEKEAKEILDVSRKNALDMQKNADEISKKDTNKKLKDAEEKAQWIMDSARRDVEKERLGMLNEMKNKVLDLSLKINSKVFDKKDNNKDFITKEVNSIKL